MPRASTPELEIIRCQAISVSLDILYADPKERAKHASFTGGKHTEETLRKMSIAQSGSNNAMWNKGKAGSRKDYIREQYLAGKSCKDLAGELNVPYQTIAYHLRNMGILRSRAEGAAIAGKQGKYSVFGEKNHWWKGGICPNEYPGEFNEELKERIRERDNRQCQNCGIDETDCYRLLDVHHIDGDKQNCEDDNLISYCTSCHAKIELTDLRLLRYGSVRIAGRNKRQKEVR